MVTVVTVALNAGEDLKHTMESVISQTYPSVEYIIIDGGSTDRSISFIEAFQEQLAYWISEPDGGIYDAMNKGIKRAKGEWIIFLNAGDSFAAPDVVEKAFSVSHDNVDFVYGDVEHLLRDGRQKISARPLDLMWQRIAFSHQCLFSRTGIMKRNPFVCSYRVVADYEFYFKMHCGGANFRYLPFVVASISPAGFSGDMLWRRTFERWHVARTHRPCLETDLYYVKHIILNIVPQAGRRMFRGLSFGKEPHRRAPT